MKIISPYKDYYDYLSGIYGVDPKIVLDRRDHDEISTEGTVSLVICGKSYDGLFKNGKYHWGSDLEMFNEFDRAFPNKNKNKNPYDAIFIREYWEFLFKTPQKDYLDINNKLNCPIVLVQRSNKSSDTTYHKYPILQKLDFTTPNKHTRV